MSVGVVAAAGRVGAVLADAAECFDFIAADKSGGAHDVGEVLFVAEMRRLGGLKEDEFLEERLFGGFEMAQVGIAIAAADRKRGAACFAQRERGGAGFRELAKNFFEGAGNQPRHRVGQREGRVDGFDVEQGLPSLSDGGAPLTQRVEDKGRHSGKIAKGGGPGCSSVAQTGSSFAIRRRNAFELRLA